LKKEKKKIGIYNFKEVFKKFKKILDSNNIKIILSDNFFLSFFKKKKLKFFFSKIIFLLIYLDFKKAGKLLINKQEPALI
jgi:hypothetical protein